MNISSTHKHSHSLALGMIEARGNIRKHERYDLMIHNCIDIKVIRYKYCFSHDDE